VAGVTFSHHVIAFMEAHNPAFASRFSICNITFHNCSLSMSLDINASSISESGHGVAHVEQATAGLIC